MEREFLMVQADRTRLLVPCSMVFAIDHLAQSPRPTAQFGIGAGAESAGCTRFAALSSALTPLPAVPAGRIVVTRMSHGGTAVGLCWNDARVVQGPSGGTRDFHPLIGRLAAGRLVGYTSDAAGLAYIPSPRWMLELIASLEDAQDDTHA